MIRLLALYSFTLFLCVNSFRDWFKSLCGLIIMMAIIEHPDVPRSMMDIPGLNVWNIIFMCVLAGWFLQRRREGLKWDMPKHISILLIIYVLVIVVGFGRMLMDRDLLPPDTTVSSLISEELINTLKWIVPGLLLFDGCRTRSRFLWAIGAILGIYIVLAIQVVKWIPPSYAVNGDLMARTALKLLMNEVGYHRVTLSMMLAGASWGIFATRPLAETRFQKLAIPFLFLLVVYAQGLTGGRAGYATWGLLGLILCLIAWRKYLPLVPVAALLIVLIAPGIAERMMQGFSQDTVDQNDSLARAGLMTSGGEMYTVTAGRNVAWQFVIAKIKENPIVGYGRGAMYRTGVAWTLEKQFGENFPHPHNAYLEMLLDNGIVGFVLVIPFYVIVVKRSLSLLRDKRSPVYMAMGGVCGSLTLALLLASMGSQSFYPIEGTVGLWCAIGLMFRISVDRERLQEQEVPATISTASSAVQVFESSGLDPWAPAPAASVISAPVTKPPVRGWRAAMEPKSEAVTR